MVHLKCYVRRKATSDRAAQENILVAGAEGAEAAAGAGEGAGEADLKLPGINSLAAKFGFHSAAFGLSVSLDVACESELPSWLMMRPQDSARNRREQKTGFLEIFFCVCYPTS